ncbi:TY5A, partial [Symbiodinium sp. CCMP2456]
VRERQKMPAALNSRKHPTGGRRSDLKEVSEWCQKHTMDPTSGRVHRRGETRSEILDGPAVAVHEDEEVDDDMRHFKETIENWNLHTEAFPLPIQPVCPTLRPVEERKEDDEPFIMFSHDILVCCYDAPELTYDEHFSKVLPGKTSPSHFVVYMTNP